MNKLQINKPKKNIDSDEYKNFLKGAEDKTKDPEDTVSPVVEIKEEKKTSSLPWEPPTINDSNSKIYPLHLPESYKAKLEWLTQQTERPQAKIMRSILLPAIDKLVEKELKS